LTITPSPAAAWDSRAPRRLLVKIARLQLEQVQLFPGQREETRRRCRVEHLPLLHGYLAVPVSHVMADHAPFEGRQHRLVPPQRDGFI
jgi:hypothetical protein